MYFWSWKVILFFYILFYIFSIAHVSTFHFQGGKGDSPKCIDKSKLCDGVQDCTDGADEKDACCEYPV